MKQTSFFRVLQQHQKIACVLATMLCVGIAWGVSGQPWRSRIQAANSQQLSGVDLPQLALQGGSISVDGQSGDLSYVIPLAELPAYKGAAPELGLSYEFGTNEGAGRHWSISPASIRMNILLGSSGLWGRTEKGPFELGGITGLEWKGTRLIYQGVMPEGSATHDLRLSAYNFQLTGAVQSFGTESSEHATRIWFTDKEFSFCLRSCSQAGGSPITVSSGFIVRNPDGSMEIYSGDPRVAEGDFTEYRVKNKLLPPLISRWPLIYSIPAGGHEIRYSYEKLGQGNTSYLVAVDFAGGQSRYEFETCEIGSTLCPFAPESAAYPAGHPSSQRFLYTKIIASFKGSIRDQWCLFYRGQNADDRQLSSWGHAPSCEKIIPNEAVVDQQSRNPFLHSVRRFGSTDVNLRAEELARHPDIVFTYAQPQPLTSTFAISQPETLKGFSDWQLGYWLDIDGDGDSDYFEASQNVRINIGQSKAELSEARVLSSAIPNLDFKSGRMQWADLNGDRLQDIIELVDGQGFQYYLNQGSKGFAQPVRVADSNTLDVTLSELVQGTAFFTDFNGDSDSDLILLRGNKMRILLNQIRFGAGFDARFPEFTLPHSQTTLQQQLENGTFQLVDMNADYLPDLVYTSTIDSGYCIYPQTGINLLYLRNLKAPSELFADLNESESPCQASSGPAFVSLPNYAGDWVSAGSILFDVDGDGLLDVLVLDQNGRGLKAWVNSNRSFLEPLTFSFPDQVIANADFRLAKTVDIDRDGRQELLIYLGGMEAHELAVLDFNLTPSGKLPMDGGNLVQVELSTGQFHRIQYASSHDELDRDQAAAPGESGFAPDFKLIVKRLISGRGSLQSIDLAKLRIQEFYYHEPLYSPFSRGFIGFAASETLELGDVFSSPSTRISGITAQTFFGIAEGSDALVGKIRETQMQSYVPSETAIDAWKDSLEEAFSESEGTLLSSWARDTAVPRGIVQTIIRSTWESTLVEGNYPSGDKWQKTLIRPLEVQTIQKDNQSTGSERIGSMVYQDYDQENFPACITNSRETITAMIEGQVPQTIPAHAIETCYDYGVSRLDLAPLGVLDKASVITVTDHSQSRPRDMSKSQITYDPSWALVKEQVETIAMDTDSLEEKTKSLLQQSSSSQRAFEFSYDGFGNIESSYDSESYSSDGVKTAMFRRVYDATGLFLIAETNAAGHTTLYCFDTICQEATPSPVQFNSQGRLSHTRSPQGVWTTYTYDDLGRIEGIASEGGLSQTYSYSYGNQDKPSLVMSQLENKAESTSSPQTIVQALDAWGQALFTLRQRNEQDSYVEAYSRYNSSGDQIALTNTFSITEFTPEDIWQGKQLPSKVQENVATSFYSFDEQDRLLSIYMTNDLETRYRYHPWGRETYAEYPDETLGRRSHKSFIVGVDNEVYATIDEQGSLLRMERDRFGMISQMHLPGQEKPRRFVHNSSGELLLAELPEIGTRIWERDSRGRVERISAYSTQGEAVQRISQRFDSINRLREVHVNGQLDSRYTYDSLADGAVSQASLGRLLEMEHWDPLQNLNSKARMSYDGFGRVIQKATTLGDRSFVEEFTYTKEGRPKDVLVSDLTQQKSMLTRYRYDGKGQLSGVDMRHPDKSEIEVLVESIAYDQAGSLSEIKFKNGIKQALVFDPTTDAIKSISTSSRFAGKTHQWQDLTYNLNGVGLITSIEDGRSESQLTQVVDRSAQMRYSPRLELEQASRYGFQWNYAFRPDGILQEAVSNQENLAMGSQAHLFETQSEAVTYDDQGQMSSAPGLTDAKFDAFGKLIQVRSEGRLISFGYGADGRRIYKKVAEGQVESLTLYPSPMIHVEAAGTEFYLFLGDQRLIRVPANDSQKWYLSLIDHLGSPEVVLDDLGQAVEEFAFTPFGQKLALNPDSAHSSSGRTSASATKYLYAGEYLDEETGLYYMGARYYHPGLGQFISPDPLFLARPELCTSSPLECSLYNYAGNDPINYSDPSGTVKQQAAGPQRAINRAKWSSGQFDKKRNKFERLQGATASGRRNESTLLGTFSKGQRDYRFSVLIEGHQGKHIAGWDNQRAEGSQFDTKNIVSRGNFVDFFSKSFKAIIDEGKSDYGLLPTMSDVIKATGTPDNWTSHDQGEATKYIGIKYSSAIGTDSGKATKTAVFQVTLKVDRQTTADRRYNGSAHLVNPRYIIHGYPTMSGRYDAMVNAVVKLNQ